MELLIIVVINIGWIIYMYVSAPFYDEKKEVFYKKKKK